MREEQYCVICRIKFSEALWCRSENCPCTQFRKPTPEMREALKMDDEAR